MLMLVGLQIGLHSYCQRIDSARAGRARNAARRSPARSKPRGTVTA